MLGLGAVLIAGVLWLASGGAFKQKYDLYLAVSDESVSGLNLNAPVKYNGVDIGKVRDIRLDPRNQARVNLLFAIEQGTPIKQDTVAVLKIQGLTGIAYVELSGGADSSPLLQVIAGNAYPLIPTKPSLSARLENILTTLMTKLDSTSSGINALLSEENRAAFTAALTNVATVAKTVAARKTEIDAAMADAARTFANTSRASAQAGPAIERIARSAEALERMGNEVTQTSTSAGKTSESIDAAVKRFNAGTLPELERLIGEVNVLAASLRRLSEKVEGSPGGLLLGRSPVPPGPGEETAK